MSEYGYDYNVWSDEDNKLTLTAYRLKIIDLGGRIDINTDTESYESITFSLPNDYEEILYLIDQKDPAEHLAQHGLQDYDDWVSQEFIDRGRTPESILKFVQSLQDYTPRKEIFDLVEQDGYRTWKERKLA
jgi:hypothetical protein